VLGEVAERGLVGRVAEEEVRRLAVDLREMADHVADVRADPVVAPLTRVDCDLHGAKSHANSSMRTVFGPRMKGLGRHRNAEEREGLPCTGAVQRQSAVEESEGRARDEPEAEGPGLQRAAVLAVVEQVAALVLEARALGGARHAAAERVAGLA